MSRIFRFGIIGAGKIAKTFCNAVLKVEGAEVAAIASQTPKKARQFAEEMDISAWYDNYEEMLKREDIDGVYIATTHNFHYENMLLALKYKKHILCEKAFVLTEEQAQNIFQISEKSGVFVMEGMWSRFLPSIKHAKELITAGALGQIDAANFTIGFHADEYPEGRMRNPNLAGGAMYDIGVYAIEIMTYLIPEKLIDIKYAVTYTSTGVDKVNCLILQFENCIVNLQAVMTCNVSQSLNIFGTEGRIYIENPHHSDRIYFYDNNGLKEEFYSRRDNGFELEIQDMISCIENGKLESDIIPHKDTLECAKIFDLCLKNRIGR